MVLALGLRFVSVVRNYGLDNDSLIYLYNARDFAAWNLEGETLTRVPVLFPGLMATGMRAGLATETAGHLINCLAGALGAVGLYMLALEVVPRRQAVVAGVLFAAMPSLAKTGGLLLTEPLHIMLTVWVAYFTVVGVRHRCLVGMSLAGVMLGLCAVCRIEGIAYLVPVTAAIFLCNFPKVLKPLGWKLASLVLVVVLCLAGTIPFGLMTRHQTGTWSITTPAFQRETQTTPASQQPKTDTASADGSPKPASTNQVFALMSYGMKSVTGLLKISLPRLPKLLAKTGNYVFLFLALVGIVFWTVQRKWTRAGLFLAAFWGWRIVLVSCLTAGSSRFLLPVAPGMALWSAVALAGITELFKQHRDKVLVGTTALLVLVGTIFVFKVENASGIVRREVSSYINTDAKSRGVSDIGIASFEGQFAYYAKARWFEIFLPDRPEQKQFESFIEACRTDDVQYLIVPRRKDRPDWKPYKGFIVDFNQRIGSSGLILLKSFYENSESKRDPDHPRIIDVYRIP